MWRVFSVAAVAVEAVATSLLSSAAKQHDGLPIEALYAAVTLLPVACCVSRWLCKPDTRFQEIS